MLTACQLCLDEATTGAEIPLHSPDDGRLNCSNHESVRFQPRPTGLLNYRLVSPGVHRGTKWGTVAARAAVGESMSSHTTTKRGNELSVRGPGGSAKSG